MTQEEKQLLLKDLCARLPYGIKILDIPANVVGNLFLVSTTDTVQYEPAEDETNDNAGHQTLYNIKPYLRPMSSMTEEEVIEYLSVCDKDYKDSLTTPRHSGADWLNEHHVDYRGLIEKCLALEAPEGMYKTE